MNILADTFSRKINYLRISITDHCNLNCLYCVPFGGRVRVSHAEIFSYEEIVRVCEAAVLAGISKLRITGGEPLMRKGVVELCRMLSGIQGLESLTLTTNGVRLRELAPQLRDAGVQRVNVSLDTLRPERFRKITGYNLLSQVLTGISMAEEVGLHPVKINTVVMRGLNEDEIEDFARLTLEEPYHVRFIELMPFNGSSEHQSLFVPVEEMVKRVKRVGDLSLEPALESSGPARLCSLPGAKGKVGFIAPLSYHFCGSCNRLRLTADGKLRTCLFSEQEIDIKGPLRAGASTEELVDTYRLAAMRKPHGHHLNSTHVEKYFGRGMQAIGG
ncbi:MAG: GTP 3',8-cyclase MoaA [Deltaproteobacteria bacterium]|nr:MAG: GTP 3',8-cyclase MoaA [Deltaproteobacteria bacterium]